MPGNKQFIFIIRYFYNRIGEECVFGDSLKYFEGNGVNN